MNNLLKLPNPRQTEEQAAEWIVGLEEGLSEEQRQKLHEWLETDPAHGVALVRLAEVWDGFDALAELAVIFPLAQRGDHRPKAFAFNVAACAAVALLAIGMVAATLYLRAGRGRVSGIPQNVTAGPVEGSPEKSQRATATAEFVAQTYHTTVGKQLSAPLSDGSVITLNTDTAVQVEYSVSRRLVILKKGEANFSVAHNTSRPFQVQVGERVVQAVGTVFNVRLGSQADVQVTVSEGTVRVLDHEPPQTANVRTPAALPDMLVRAGEQALISDSGEQVHRIEVSQLEASGAWQRGMLVYKGETLDAVIADVSRYTTVRFSISDESIRSKRVGGVFRTGDVDGLLLALHESFGIEARRQGNVIVLTARR